MMCKANPLAEWWYYQIGWHLLRHRQTFYCYSNSKNQRQSRISENDGGGGGLKDGHQSFQTLKWGEENEEEEKIEHKQKLGQEVENRCALAAAAAVALCTLAH